MGKKRKLGRAAPSRHQQRPSQSKPSQTKSPKSSQTKSKSKKTLEAPTIPFRPDEDAILLVGEGDLSFARSLVEHHACADVTATVLEPSPDALVAKYPQAAEHAAAIIEDDNDKSHLLYGVDARTMGSNGPLKARRGRIDRILFNFPHVGGKSTDVNRQVRYNQELLVDFFRRALVLLAPGGSVVVTLFEGEPYTLWNIRDLGRHAGLQVERSFRFQFGAYPGYHHARTLGIVRRGGDGDGDNENENEKENDISSSAWRGEDRPARSYVFVRKGETAEATEAAPKKRKRARESSDDDDDDD